MAKTIKFALNEKSIKNAIKEIEDYKREFQLKNQRFIDKLADVGLLVVRQTMESVPSDDKGTYYTEVINTSDGDIVGASIRLTGDKVLFIEFSAGITYGTDSYPLPIGNNYGVGTYPGQTHAYDPNGWWYRDDTGNLHHSYGNRAYMPMYHAEETIVLQVKNLAKQIFES